MIKRKIYYSQVTIKIDYEKTHNKLFMFLLYSYKK